MAAQESAYDGTAEDADRFALLDDKALVRLVADADVGAFGEIYRRHSAALYGLALRVLRDDALAADTVQEAFLVLWQRAGAYQPDRGNVRGWLYAVTHHKAVDLVRREDAHQRRRAHLHDAAEVPSADDVSAHALAVIARTKVLEAVDGLPPLQRECLLLAYFSGLTRMEIAGLIGAPLGTVKSRVRSGLSRLELVLAEFAPADAALSRQRG